MTPAFEDGCAWVVFVMARWSTGGLSRPTELEIEPDRWKDGRSVTQYPLPQLRWGEGHHRKLNSSRLPETVHKCCKFKSYLADSISGSEWTMQKITRAWFLHDFCPWVSTEFTKSIIAEYYWFVFYLCICYDKVPIWKKRKNRLKKCLLTRSPIKVPKDALAWYFQ